MIKDIFNFAKSFLGNRLEVPSAPDESVPDKMISLIMSNGGNFKHGHPFFIGIRNENSTDSFNDLMCVLYRDAVDGKNRLFAMQGTTDPGLGPTRHYKKKGGVRILCKGMYNDFWVFGYNDSSKRFGGRKMPLMRQYGKSPAKTARDQNGNGIIDVNEPIDVGYFGIENHAMSYGKGFNVGWFSEGCQGARKYHDHLKAMAIVKDFEDNGPKGRKFYSYWLTSVDNLELPKELLDMCRSFS